MHYTIRRDGQELGVHSRNELPALLKSGTLRDSDLAETNGSASVTIRELLDGPPPIPTATGSSYLVRRGEQQFGPYALAMVHRYREEGRLASTDVLWTAGMTTWEPVDTLLRRHHLPIPPGAPDVREEGLAWVIPVGRSGYAIAAGYLGLFSVLLFPAPFAVLFGVLALRDLKRNQRSRGAGRAWFGIVAGALGTIGLALFIFALIFSPAQ